MRQRRRSTPTANRLASAPLEPPRSPRRGGVPPACRDSIDAPVRRPKSRSKAIVVRVSPTGFSAWSGVTTQATKDTTAKATANTTGRRRQTTGGDHFANFVAAMKRRGFTNYDQEWWHFTYAVPDSTLRRFDIPIR